MRLLTLLRAAAALLIAFTIGVISLPADAQAVTQAAAQAPTFTYFHMINPTDGWAVVTGPDTGATTNDMPGDVYAGNMAYILHTHDGGHTWVNVTSVPPIDTLLPAGGYGCDCSDNGIGGFFFLDSSHAWEMIDDAGFPGNQIFNGISVRSTSDGGQSWQHGVEGMNAPYVITSDFIDPQHGWILAGGIPDPNGTDQPAMLFQTLDGGTHWNLIADDGTYTHLTTNPNTSGDPVSPLATGITPLYHNDMAFDSKASGWMLVDAPDGYQANLLHTSNGGVNWNPVTVSPNLSSDDCALNQLTVDASSAISFLAGCLSGQILYHSADDGKTWQGNPFPADMLDLYGWPQLFMLNSTTAWALGCDKPASAQRCDDTAPTNLYTTADAGKTWSKVGVLPDAFKPVTANYIETDPTLEFVDDQVGWALTPSNMLFTTSDGGKTWSAITLTISGI